MRVFVIYGTIEGQTRKIARAIAETAQDKGWRATVYDMNDLAEADPAHADRVIIAAPVHAGDYPPEVAEWIKANRLRLKAMPTAFVSVSLSAASQFAEEHEALDKITNAFFEETGFAPNAVHQAAGALRYADYDFLKRLLMRYIARKEGASTDTSKNHEFTEWDELARFIADFLAPA